jgi:hypothetical protein
MNWTSAANQARLPHLVVPAPHRILVSEHKQLGLGSTGEFKPP